MRSLAILTRLLPILFILLFACQPEEEKFLDVDPEIQEVENFISDAEDVFLDPSSRLATSETPCGDPLEIPLMAYRREIGKISITNTTDHLLVKYATYSGFVFHRTFLVLMIESKNADNSIWKYTMYKKVMLPVSHEEGIEEYRYEIPFSKLDLNGDECITIIGVAKLKEMNSSDDYRTIYAIAKDITTNSQSLLKRYFIEYCLQECEETSDKGSDPVSEDPPCPVQCEFGIGVPSVDILESYSFKDLNITDWPWGYTHAITNETFIRLPIKSTDSESAPAAGQATVIIEGDIAYVYFQMNSGYKMSKSSLYFSNKQPTSGIPCDFTYVREYTNPDGTWNPTLMDTYEISNISQLMANNISNTDSRNDDDDDDNTNVDNKLWIIAYVDYCQ
jgi:hypothetical protein